jgi:hypothetical protein
MPEAVTERPARAVYKFDPEKVRAYREQGLSVIEIGKLCGVAHTTIWRFLEAENIKAGRVKFYREHRADILSNLQDQVGTLLYGSIESLQKDIDNGVLDARTPERKAGIIRDLAVVKGVLFDKERLERGQSTENVSVMGKVIADVQGGLFKNQQVTEEVARPTKAHYSGNRPEGDPSGEKPGAGGPDGSDVAIG